MCNCGQSSAHRTVILSRNRIGETESPGWPLGTTYDLVRKIPGAKTPTGAEMTSNDRKFDGVVADLREQGLTVTLHSALNHTWYVKGEGLFNGYIASGTEMLELKCARKLNIHGIKSLG
jgi:hypothetical protein